MRLTWLLEIKPGAGIEQAELMSISKGENRRRSERVMLQVPVLVLAKTVRGEQLHEETQTLVVNAHGGLMLLKMEVMHGQPILLVNPKSGVEAPARIVRIDNPPGGHIAVAFEFDEPHAKFWPVEFPPTDWGKPGK